MNYEQKKKKPKRSICEHCNSAEYCPNRVHGTYACINYNKFPKKDKITHY